MTSVEPSTFSGSSDDAIEIASQILEGTGQALLSGNFHDLLKFFTVPTTILTSAETIILSSEADLETTMQGVIEEYRNGGVTAVDREVVEAAFKSPDEILSVHVSQMLCGDTPLGEAVPVLSNLVRTAEGWKITRSEYAVGGADIRRRALQSVWKSDPEAKQIYQDHLDAFSTTLISGTPDNPDFTNRLTIPYSMTSKEERFFLTTPQEIYDVAKRYIDYYRNEGVTQLLRVVKRARFVSSHEIIGLHETHKMRDSKRLGAPYEAKLRLVRNSQGQWRESHCAYAPHNISDDYTTWTRVGPARPLPTLTT